MQDFRSTALTIALMVLCCALPLLIISGVSIAGGAVFGQTALVLVGLAGIGYAVYKVTRRRRRS